MSLKQRIAAGTLALASAVLMAFLGTWEGRGQNVVYADKLAGGLPTVCKGITRYTSPYPVVVGEYWSDAKCEEVEKRVVKETQIGLAHCISNRAISQNAFDALSSHAHNFGVGKTCGSDSVKLINQGKMAEGCRALAYTPSGKPNWSSVKGKFYQGLHNRRIAEMKLCLKAA